MEKLALYLFTAAVLTLGLAVLSYVAAAVLGRRVQPARVLATSPRVGPVDIGLSEEPARSGIGRYGTMLAALSAVMLLATILARASVSGRGPFANMYDFSIAFAFGIVLVYLAIYVRYPVRMLGLIMLPIALALVAYAASVPSQIQPLVPALQHNTLLTLHVSVAILAYACFAASFSAGTLYLVQQRWKSTVLPSLDTLDDIGFLSAALGFPFMTLVLVLGAYWANIAWGRYWGWDPKETASLVTWLLYAAYLHARALRQWRGQRAAILLVVGFVAVMLTYFGNYFLGGLHSYA